MKNSSSKKLDIDKLSESIKEYLPNFNEEKFKKAFEFAKKAHDGQFRKDGKTPYISHPFSVAEILVNFHADEDTLVSTLLHDIPEDTSYTIANIKELFGEKIAFLVDGITKLSKVYYRKNMPERQIKSLKKLFLHSSTDLRVVLIKLADRLHNMRTLGNISDEDKRTRISKETLEIYVPIADLLGIQELRYQLEDICFKYLYPEQYEYIYKKRKQGYKERKESSRKFIQILQDEFEKQKINAKVFDRKKNLYSIYKKVYSKGKITNNLDNRLSIRVIVDNLEDCYKALGIIHSRFTPKIDRFRDYIATPKTNGYQSLHTTVFGLDSLLSEVQIRTVRMDLEANYGVIAGFFLENKIDSKQKRVAWVKKVIDIDKRTKKSQEFIETLKGDIFQKRIFVFTPTGESVDLPKGACILDFAYAIHTELGQHVSQAYVNNIEQKISETLHTGDVVKIITSKKTTPNLNWLDFVKTNNAKIKILDYLKKVRNEKKIIEGVKILQKEMDIAGMGLIENVNFKKLAFFMGQKSNYRFEDIESLLKAIGSGQIKASTIIGFINLYNKKKHGSDDILKKSYKDGVRINIRIIAKNRSGLMEDLTKIIYPYALFIFNFKCSASNHEKNALFSADIFIDNLSSLSRLSQKIEQLKDVVCVYSVPKKTLWTISILTLLTASFWIFHPFFFHFVYEKLLLDFNSLLGKIIIYGSLFVLIIAVLSITSIFKKYFPYVRHRKRLYIVSFLVPLLAATALVAEILFFKTPLNLTIIFIQILLIYAYLFINIFGEKKSIWKT